jgi:hypothetical protein
VTPLAKSSSHKQPEPTPLAATEFLEFEIRAWRERADAIQVTVQASPAGGLPRPLEVEFSERSAASLRPSFSALPTGNTAMEIGRELARVLLPPPIYQLLHQSIDRAKAARARGLRLRLALDPVLTDLQWELLFRPELPSRARSGFLLLDPFFSIVRGLRSRSAEFPKASRKQRLLFLGAIHESGSDIFEVKKEFAGVKKSLVPLGALLEPSFVPASDAAGISRALSSETAVFHYSGNTYIENGLAYCVAHAQSLNRPIRVAELALRLAAAKVRMALFNATDSHSSALVEPILNAGVPIVVAFNGPYLTTSTSIDFCGALYRALAVGLSIDEAVGYGRSHLAEKSLADDAVDWGLFTVHVATGHAVPFPRPDTGTRPAARQATRVAYDRSAAKVRDLVERLDGDDYGALLSELSERGVLILGRFTDRRRRILEAIKKRLKEHPAGYKPVLFTFERPTSRDLIESIRSFAGAVRFIIADITEPNSVPAEIQAIVPQNPSVPLVAIRAGRKRAYPVFQHIRRFEWVAKEPVPYRTEADLLTSLDRDIVPWAEATRERQLAGISDD